MHFVYRMAKLQQNNNNNNKNNNNNDNNQNHNTQQNQQVQGAGGASGNNSAYSSENSGGMSSLHISPTAPLLAPPAPSSQGLSRSDLESLCHCVLFAEQLMRRAAAEGSEAAALVASINDAATRQQATGTEQQKRREQERREEKEKQKEEQNQETQPIQSQQVITGLHASSSTAAPTSASDASLAASIPTLSSSSAPDPNAVQVSIAPMPPSVFSSSLHSVPWPPPGLVIGELDPDFLSPPDLIEPDWMHTVRVQEMVDEAFNMVGSSGGASSAASILPPNTIAPISAYAISAAHASIASADAAALSSSSSSPPPQPTSSTLVPASAPTSPPISPPVPESGLSVYHFGKWLQYHPEILDILDASFLGTIKGLGLGPVNAGTNQHANNVEADSMRESRLLRMGSTASLHLEGHNTTASPLNRALSLSAIGSFPYSPFHSSPMSSLSSSSFNTDPLPSTLSSATGLPTKEQDKDTWKLGPRLSVTSMPNTSAAPSPAAAASLSTASLTHTSMTHPLSMQAAPRFIKSRKAGGGRPRECTCTDWSVFFTTHSAALTEGVDRFRVDVDPRASGCYRWLKKRSVKGHSLDAERAHHQASREKAAAAEAETVAKEAAEEAAEEAAKEAQAAAEMAIRQAAETRAADRDKKKRILEELSARAEAKKKVKLYH